MAHRLGHHGGNPKYDLTGDDEVNARDLVFVVKCFITERFGWRRN
jgi:hypothetical protein